MEPPVEAPVDPPSSSGLLVPALAEAVVQSFDLRQRAKQSLLNAVASGRL